MSHLFAKNYQRLARYGLSLALLLYLCAPVGTVEKINITLDRAKLDRGELQTFMYDMKTGAGAIKKRVIGVVVIDAPPGRVWQVLENWEAMAAFVPGLMYYKVIYRVDPAVSIIEGQVKVAFIKIMYTLKVTFDRVNRAQKWVFVTDDEADAFNERGIPVKRASSNIINVEGFEYIEPFGGGSRTIYYYAPVVEATGVPEWLERLIARRGLEGYMLGVKKRAEGK